MMTEYVPYVTQQNDRWDSIAHRFYGDRYGYERIIAANPTVPIRPVLPAGLKLAIPLIERTAAQTIATKLPPWKRSNG
jgi:phage tail protein X